MREEKTGQIRRITIYSRYLYMVVGNRSSDDGPRSHPTRPPDAFAKHHHRKGDELLRKKVRNYRWEGKKGNENYIRNWWLLARSLGSATSDSEWLTGRWRTKAKQYRILVRDLWPRYRNSEKCLKNVMLLWAKFSDSVSGIERSYSRSRSHRINRYKKVCIIFCIIGSFLSWTSIFVYVWWWSRSRYPHHCSTAPSPIYLLNSNETDSRCSSKLYYKQDPGAPNTIPAPAPAPAPTDDWLELTLLLLGIWEVFKQHFFFSRWISFY